MHKLVFFSLLSCFTTAHADVFKCTSAAGQTVYQATPCQTSSQSRQLAIESDPAQEAAAKARLEALRSEQKIQEAAERSAEKEKIDEQAKIESALALKRSAIAQEKQAEAERRQAAAMEQTNRVAPVILYPATPRFPPVQRHEQQYMPPPPHTYPLKGRN